jgi:hypothetical protein
VRIELSWPRSAAAARTLTVDIPDAAVSGLVRPLLRHARGAVTPTAVWLAVVRVRPVIGGVAEACGVGALLQLALALAEAPHIPRQRRMRGS